MNMKTLKKVAAGAVLASSFGVAAPLADAHGFGPNHQKHGPGPEHHRGGGWEHSFEKGKTGPVNALQRLQEGDQFGGLTVTSVDTIDASTVVQLDGDVKASGYYDIETGTLHVISINNESFLKGEKPQLFKGHKQKAMSVTIKNAKEASALLEGTGGLEPSKVILSNIELTAAGKDVTVSADLSVPGETKTEEP